MLRLVEGILMLIPSLPKKGARFLVFALKCNIPIDWNVSLAKIKGFVLKIVLMSYQAHLVSIATLPWYLYPLYSRISINRGYVQK